MTISEPAPKPCSIRWVEETDSTQNEILKHIDEYDNMSVVAARYQTSGRGQRGNSWHSERGLNMTFSMLLRFGDDGLQPLRALDQFGITRAMTLAVCDYLEGEGINCMIKWPNDIYARNRKICGMLIENILEGEYVSHSIAGIGLNVNQKDFPGQLLNPTSMALQTGKDYSLENGLEKLCSSIVSCLRKGYYMPGSEAKALYLDRLYRLGRFEDYARCPGGEVFNARIVGVSDEGKLIVENRKGELEKFAFKEISYII
ncbi:MAG: biotin--[Bacteroidales bacterium]|nr:biotin--[acetyl-CoA-carboxylase] ligase [Bacteroidales bacterium]